MEEKRVDSICEIDMSGLKLPLIAVYEHPDDFPDKCVARFFDGDKPTDTVIVKNRLSDILDDIRSGTDMIFMLRMAEGVPSLVGTWI